MQTASQGYEVVGAGGKEQFAPDGWTPWHRSSLLVISNKLHESPYAEFVSPIMIIVE